MVLGGFSDNRHVLIYANSNITESKIRRAISTQDCPDWRVGDDAAKVALIFHLFNAVTKDHRVLVVLNSYHFHKEVLMRATSKATHSSATLLPLPDAVGRFR